MLCEACLAAPFTVKDFEPSLNEMTVGGDAFSTDSFGLGSAFQRSGHSVTLSTKVLLCSIY